MVLEQSFFICPVCKSRLFKMTGILKCMNGHCFDISKEGYVNLLMSNAHGKRHGDDKLMVKSRKEFLDKGYYSVLRDKLSAILGKDQTVLDSGCGEGYYTSALAENNRVLGIDISKDALKFAAKRCHNAEFAVASVSDIPLPSDSVDAVVNIFAPDSPEEFLRILKKGGRYISVTPMENHLFALKSVVYDKPYINPKPSISREGFSLISSEEIKYKIRLNCNEDIISLFKMTPYYYKTSKTDQEKLERIDSLITEIEFLVCEYEKL